MLAELASGFSSLQALTKVVQGLTATATQAQVNDAKIALQNHIISIQSALSAAQLAEANATQRIRELEQQIVQFEDWQAEKQRYELKAIDTGALAYMLKPGMENGEPAQWLCTNCFEKRQKGRLGFAGQMSTPGGGRGMFAKWSCDTCRRDVQVYYARKPSEPWEPKERPT